MKYVIASIMLVSSFTASADGFGPYNQQYTMNSNQNMQYGATNWYSSALGMGVAQAGVTLIGGLVNAMSRPDPVVQQQPQVVYVNGNGGQGQGQYYSNQAPVPAPNYAYSAPQGIQTPVQRCNQQTVYDQDGNPRYVNICE